MRYYGNEPLPLSTRFVLVGTVIVSLACVIAVL
jgi:hypothetical protein